MKFRKEKGGWAHDLTVLVQHGYVTKDADGNYRATPEGRRAMAEYDGGLEPN